MDLSRCQCVKRWCNCETGSRGPVNPKFGGENECKNKKSSSVCWKSGVFGLSRFKKF